MKKVLVMAVIIVMASCSTDAVIEEKTPITKSGTYNVTSKKGITVYPKHQSTTKRDMLNDFFISQYPLLQQEYQHNYTIVDNDTIQIDSTKIGQLKPLQLKLDKPKEIDLYVGIPDWVQEDDNIYIQGFVQKEDVIASLGNRYIDPYVYIFPNQKTRDPGSYEYYSSLEDVDKGREQIWKETMTNWCETGFPCNIKLANEEDNVWYSNIGSSYTKEMIYNAWEVATESIKGDDMRTGYELIEQYETNQLVWESIPGIIHVPEHIFDGIFHEKPVPTETTMVPTYDQNGDKNGEKNGIKMKLYFESSNEVVKPETATIQIRLKIAKRFIDIGPTITQDFLIEFTQ